MRHPTPEEREKRLAELIEGKAEFCVICLRTMDFLKSEYVYAPARFKDGASYSEEGAGQTCGDCNRAIEKPKRGVSAGAS